MESPGLRATTLDILIILCFPAPLRTSRAVGCIGGIGVLLLV